MNEHADILNNKPFENHTKFEDRKGDIYAFVKFYAPDKILCWEPMESRLGNAASLRKFRVINLDQKILEELDVWKQLAKEQQDKVMNWNSEHKELVQERMEKARTGRKDKYPDLPGELTCNKCKKVTVIQKSVLAQRIEKQGVLADDYVRDYICKGCNKADYTGMPDKLVCACGFEVTYHPSMIAKMAEKKGMEVEEFVSAYVCQTCNPTRGKHKSISK